MEDHSLNKRLPFLMTSAFEFHHSIYEEMGKFLRKIRNESVCIIEKFKLSYLYTSILL